MEPMKDISHTPYKGISEVIINLDELITTIQNSYIQLNSQPEFIINFLFNKKYAKRHFEDVLNLSSSFISKNK